MQVTIYEGSSRKTTKWRPRHEEWESFASRFATPVRTPESLAEYKRMTRDERGAAKDVGGFVGGVLKDRKRSKSTIDRRTLITLDADEADLSMIVDFQLMGFKGLIYSTHSHTPEKPKLRLVIPTITTLTPDQYPGVVNYFAHVLGVDQFDPTSDEPERLMYWPSCPQDGEYIYEKIDGELFDGLKFLQDNPEWEDAAMWTLSAKKRKEVTDRAKKAQDPREKKGVIGAFCRVYDIHSGIEAFLGDVYEPVADSDRYTFIGGSTFNGVHTHEDLWAYSHHATDPAGCQLCNIWDLVRLHKFEGDQDAMLEWTGELAEVKQELAISAFRDEDVPEEKQLWLKELEFSNRGLIIQSIRNCRLILDNDERFKGMFRYNELSERIEANPSLYWRYGKNYSWTEQDMSVMMACFEKEYGLNRLNNLTHAFNGVLADNRYNPIKEYLESLAWDGKERLETLLVDYLGAEDTQYVRTATKKWMVAAVARVLTPGCQFDHMLILNGPQGIGKSTLLKRLAGPRWFNDSLDKLGGGKESAEQIRGYWIISIDELSALKKIGEAQEQIKNFLTRTTDSYRPAYGRYVVDIPRQCVFAGTTNESEFLQDHTGARRFWTVQVTKKSDIIWSDEFPRDQLWAEALSYFQLGEDLYLGSELEGEAAKVQENFTQKDALVGSIEEFVAIQIPTNWDDMSVDERRDWYISPQNDVELMDRKTVCAYEIYCEMMGNIFGDFPRRKQLDINRALKQAGYRASENRPRVPIYGRQRVYSV